MFAHSKMETIDIQSRSYVVKWIRASNGDTVSFQMKPLKKSINFGIYRKDHSSTADLSEVKTETDQKGNAIRFPSENEISMSTDHGKDKNTPLTTKLSLAGLTKVAWYGSISGNEVISESFRSTCDDCYYAFIMDNSSSKQSKRRCLLTVNTKREVSEAIDDTEDYDENCSSRSNATESISLKNTQNITQPLLKEQPTFASSTGSIVSIENTNAFPRPVSPVMPAKSGSPSSGLQSTLRNGRIFQGYLLKKKRKKLQGFSKRFFKLDLKYGTLCYYLDGKSSTCRGEIVIPLSSVSANKRTRLIIVDSGIEIWVMKARDYKEWEQWIKQLELCFQQPISNNESVEEKAQSLKISHDTMTSAFLHSLTSLRKGIEECKNQSLSYSAFTVLPQPTAINSRQRNISRSSSVSSLINPFLRQRNGSTSDVSNQINEFSGSSLMEQQYHDLYKRLSELERLAKQIDSDACSLAQNWSNKTPPASIFSNDEFFDAIEEEACIVMINDDVARDNIRPIYSAYGEGKDDDDDDEEEDELGVEAGESEETNEVIESLTSSQTDILSSEEVRPSSSNFDLYPLPLNFEVNRRTNITGPASSPPSLLSFFRKNVGKDLSSVSMPITSNEPVSILQVLSEAFEYSNLLNKAAQETENPLARLQFVSAFALSYLSIHRQKVRSLRKPFTPLLGETYELVREDMGIRLISEKVSHKPAIFAYHVEHYDWVCTYTVTPVQKFWGKSIEFTNEGQFELVFRNDGSKYLWSQPTVFLKNIIAGERYMEPANEFSVICSNSTKAIIEFRAGGMFSGRSEDVNITISDANSRKVSALKGQWTNQIIDPQTGQVIWKCGELVQNSEKKFGFTKFTSTLNEITKIEEGMIPPTDSRLRPDLRIYERGGIAEAEKLKLRLEELQRERRNVGEDAKPQYFKQIKPLKWVFLDGEDGYWERRRRGDWSNVKPLW